MNVTQRRDRLWKLLTEERDMWQRRAEAAEADTKRLDAVLSMTTPTGNESHLSCCAFIGNFVVWTNKAIYPNWAVRMDVPRGDNTIHTGPNAARDAIDDAMQREERSVREESL